MNRQDLDHQRSPDETKQADRQGWQSAEPRPIAQGRFLSAVQGRTSVAPYVHAYARHVQRGPL